MIRMNHFKNVRELRMEKVQLEFQIQEMEKKLQEVQSTKSKETEERKSSRYHWKSGKVGKLGNQSHIMSQSKGNIKLSAGKVKVKLLKEQLQELPRHPLSYKKANFSDSEKPKIKEKVCGQCENKTALLVKPQIVSNVLDVAHQFVKEVNSDEPKGENCSTNEINKSQHKPESPLLQRSSCDEMEVLPTKTGECTNPRDRLLCEGSFDEEASAQSFQEVLNEWRTRHHHGEKENLPAAKPDSLKECAVQTDLKIWREPLNIEFKEDNISYMEKLWLKKQRRIQQEQLQNRLPDTSIPQCTTTSEVQCSQNESNEESDDVETKVQCPALFLPMEELRIGRHETSVKIVKLDDTYEEEFEDQADIVPYKVKLANADSQQSCTFRDYQNAFLCANAVHQHPLLTEGKADLFHHLSGSSASCEENSKAEPSNITFDNNVDPDVYSPAVEKLGESSFFERHFKEKGINMESNQKSDKSCMSSESKDSLPSVDLDTPSVKKRLSQDIKKSLKFSNLPERSNFEDPKTTESLPWLQEIALRSKPITKKYQGLERFFLSDKNERLDLFPSPSVECSYSSTGITIAGQTIQRPSTANFPLSNSIKRSSSCLSSSYPPPRSATAQSLSRAASEISEIEHIDVTDHNEPFSDSIADQEAFGSLEKELNILRNIADPSENLSSLTSEESPAFNNDSLNISQATLDLFKTHEKDPYEIEEQSSSEKDTEI
ncbi:zinc finger B-box domain-containing protein 1 [Saccopteryx bilineata]|uniref:zinc finger B-box domain-containing protein 1 n=1 Tax=Saccopteryx bilineata TaxID=59482 RepID=UPI00338D7D3C